MYRNFQLRKEEGDHRVHGQKMSLVDVTGIHWRSKIFILSLVAFSIGLAGLIIMINISLSNQHRKESCLTENFDAWTDEFNEEHYTNQTALLKLKKVDQILRNNYPAYPVEYISTTEIKPRCNIARSLDELDEIGLMEEFIQEKLNKIIFQNKKTVNDLDFKYPVAIQEVINQITILIFKAAFSGLETVGKFLRTPCLQILAYDELISDKVFKDLLYFCIFGLKAINEFHLVLHIHLQLVKRFDDDSTIRHDLVETYLQLHRISDAKDIVEENIKRFSNNATSSLFYGLLFYQYNNYENAAHYMLLGLETAYDDFLSRTVYSSLGESLLLLNRTNEARELFRRGVKEKIFPNIYQRPSDYIMDLKAQPIWTKEETPYIDIFDLLESNWQQIRDEGLSVLNKTSNFTDETAHLTNIGLWEEFYLFSNGNESLENCESTQFTCALFQNYVGNMCKSCHVLFSILQPKTHVKPHCGPHNARLRSHLGLKVSKQARIRIVNDERHWEEGKILIFDDSFEHEVWNNGNEIRLVLIIDFWHPQVTDEQKTVLKLLGAT